MSNRSSIFGVAFFFVSSVCAIAGSASSGGPQIAPTDNASVSTYKATDTSVGASARDSAGASASQASASSGTNASSSGVSSSNGTASSSGGAPSAFGASPRGANDAHEAAAAIAREKVIDTGDKAVETDKSAKVEPRDKTFAPGMLDTVSDISAVSAQKEQHSIVKANESKSGSSEDKSDSHK
jgi:hypothetical protein